MSPVRLLFCLVVMVILTGTSGSVISREDVSMKIQRLFRNHHYSRLIDTVSAILEGKVHSAVKSINTRVPSPTEAPEKEEITPVQERVPPPTEAIKEGKLLSVVTSIQQRVLSPTELIEETKAPSVVESITDRVIAPTETNQERKTQSLVNPIEKTQAPPVVEFIKEKTPLPTSSTEEVLPNPNESVAGNAPTAPSEEDIEKAHNEKEESHMPDSPFSSQHWIECPILEGLMDHYMSGFPDITNAVDSFQIPQTVFQAILQRSVVVFRFVGNIGLTLDLLVSDIAQVFLDNQVNCTVTMYQRVFIHAMKKQLDEMMRIDDRSMLGRIVQIMLHHFPSRPDMIPLCAQIVHDTHENVFGELINILQRLEFRYLDWALHFVRSAMRNVLESNSHLAVPELTDIMAGVLRNIFQGVPQVTTCSTASDFLQIHETVAGQFADHYFKMLEIGYISGHVVRDIDLLLRLPGNGLTRPLDMGDPQVDLMIRELEGVISEYATDVMNKTKSYVEDLKSNDITQPPDVLGDALSASELADASALAARIFGLPLTTTTESGPTQYYNLTDILAIGHQQLNTLVSITNDLVESNNTDPGILSRLTNFISEKSSFLQNLQFQINNTP
ncbi:uncharacterized protein [Argopecten irradians]|uniref:uncharacterized protein isoform X2 n=1 Tax=Argopecten irradians TaxID=31199 RepID=UPI0037134C5F